MNKYTIEEANTVSIAKIALHFLESGMSLRNFASNYCEFSHVTLRNKFYTILSSTNKELYNHILEKLESKRGKSIEENSEARLRTLYAIKYLLEEDLTISEIAQRLNSTEFTIYRDLTQRAMQLDEIGKETKKEILMKLQDHKRYNLLNQRR